MDVPRYGLDSETPAVGLRAAKQETPSSSDAGNDLKSRLPGA